MIKKRFSILLILMMVITPVSAAFDHCACMVMGNVSIEQSGQQMTHATSHHLDQQSIQQDRQDEQTDKVSQLEGHCAAHSCICGILSSDSTVYLSTKTVFLGLASSLLFSTTISPEIRPPLA